MLSRIKFTKDGHTFIIDWLTIGDMLQVLADFAYEGILTWAESAGIANAAQKEYENNAGNEKDYLTFMKSCDFPSDSSQN